MNKYNLCIVALIFAIGSATLLPVDSLTQSGLAVCPPNKCATPSGCWNSCTDPKYSQCGDVFPALYNPSFCAYTKDGRYISYTYECQACKNTQVIAVRSGACSCDFINCGINRKCVDGQCVPLYPIPPVNLCLTVKCSAGFVCQDGKCVPEIVRPCTKLCIQGYICRNGQCVPDTPVDPIDKCALIRCMAGYTCQNGKCVPNFNPCSLIKCMPGFTCQKGQCVPINPCATVKCKPGYYCDNGKCIDRCVTIRCRQGYYCVAGQCIPQPGLCGAVFCAPEFSCVDGKCIQKVDLCNGILCEPGFTCQNGRCNAIETCLDPPNIDPTPVGIKPSLDSCATILCSPNSKCVNGFCIPTLGVNPDIIYV